MSELWEPNRVVPTGGTGRWVPERGTGPGQASQPTAGSQAVAAKDIPTEAVGVQVVAPEVIASDVVMSQATAAQVVAPQVVAPHVVAPQVVGPGGGERGAAVVEFVLVSVVAVVVALALAQLALFLWERNALMGSLSEGVRVAATEGRTVADGRRVTTELLRRAAGNRVASAIPIEGAEAGGIVVLRAEGTLPSFVPGVPGLPVRMTARMHEEESL